MFCSPLIGWICIWIFTTISLACSCHLPNSLTKFHPNPSINFGDIVIYSVFGLFSHWWRITQKITCIQIRIFTKIESIRPRHTPNTSPKFRPNPSISFWCSTHKQGENNLRPLSMVEEKEKGSLLRALDLIFKNGSKNLTLSSEWITEQMVVYLSQNSNPIFCAVVLSMCVFFFRSNLASEWRSEDWKERTKPWLRIPTLAVPFPHGIFGGCFNLLPDLDYKSLKNLSHDARPLHKLSAHDVKMLRFIAELFDGLFVCGSKTFYVMNHFYVYIF